jgi:tRNA(Ile)-lysidine synthase
LVFKRVNYKKQRIFDIYFDTVFYYLCYVLKDFEEHISRNGLFTKKDKLLLAVSGGIDSVVLAHLLTKAGFDLTLAHCNFQLRGKDSADDEKFCKQLAKKLGLKIFTKTFDINAYCRTHKTNTQIAARKLRYQWFHELVKDHKLDYVLTAHHANDVIETIFINLLRGTGINGIKGIPEKKGKIVRPLLNFKREAIETFAEENKIKFRLDKSNLEDKYERNFIRLNIIPELKKINPRLEETFIRNSVHFRQEAGIVNEFMVTKEQELITQTPGLVFINKKKLAAEKYNASILHYLVCGYGFNETQERNILKNILSGAVAGKMFLSATHQLTVDRNDLVIKEVPKDKFNAFKIKSLPELKKHGVFELSKAGKFTVPKKNELLVHENKLIFPLTVRTKQTGDKFRPFGMKGFKLVSDFLKDEKLNAFEKENCKLLVNGNGDIIWIAGYRSDDRYKVNKTDNNLLKLTLVG